MKKKILLLITLMLCGVFMFTGCGSAEEPADSGNGETEIAFGLEDTVTCEGLCEMSDLYCEVLDDEAMKQGWYYYYTDTDESPAKVINWEVPEEDYTTVEVLFTAKNISEEPQTFGDKVTAKMFYQEDEDADTLDFDGTVFQQNPDQTDENGEVMMWSTKPAEIKADESTNVSFRFDIPKDVYEKIYDTAKGEDAGIIETCEFTFGDGTTFIIDLTKALIAASDYEG